MGQGAAEDGATSGIKVDLVTDLIAGRPIDVLQTFQENLIQSGMGQLFGEPIDAASGAFLITATDFTLMDVCAPLKVQRKYNSTNKQEGILGQGWKFNMIETPLGGRLQATMRGGRLVQLKDSLGRTMQYRYEGGLLSDVVHMDQGVTHYEYDDRGFLVCAIDQAKVAYLRNEEERVERYVQKSRKVKAFRDSVKAKAKPLLLNQPKKFD